MRLAMEFTWLGLVENAATVVEFVPIEAPGAVVVDVGWVVGVEDGGMPGAVVPPGCGAPLDVAPPAEDVVAGEAGLTPADCAAAALWMSEVGLGWLAVPDPAPPPRSHS